MKQKYALGVSLRGPFFGGDWAWANKENSRLSVLRGEPKIRISMGIIVTLFAYSQTPQFMGR